MNNAKRVKLKIKALEAFTIAFNNYKDEPDKVWNYLIVYRRLLDENEYI